MAMPIFDDFLYDVPTRPSLRIPPLQDPFPTPSISSTRPSPLEPNTQVNIDNEANKLTGRRQALAKARSCDEFDPNEWELGNATIFNAVHDSQDVDDLPQRPQKRQKQKLYDQDQFADFVQLPKPSTKAKEDKPRPFQPVSVLNELHEPPPSAALFPPIITKANQEDHEDVSRADKAPQAPTEKRREPPRKKKAKDQAGSSSPVPRRYNRGRTKWTEEEIEQLVKGVTIYGTGRWKNILEHPSLHFHEGRTPTDLKDRFRVCFPPDKPDKWVRPKPEKQVHTDAQAIPKQSAKQDNRAKKRARKRHWTEEEDEELRRGFTQYGYDWARMVKDPDLHFDNRSSGQVRDRFRLKFKEVYATEPVARATKPAAGKAKGRNDSSAQENENEGSSQGMTGSRSLAPSLSSGLLNGEEEDMRLSNSILHTGLYLADENVTLAPVMWEDMAQKPLFAFD